MIATKREKMGRFAVEVELENRKDRNVSEAGFLKPELIRRMRVRGTVDSGATRLILPAAVAKELGLEKIGRTKVKYADGRIATRDIVGDVHLAYAGREGVFDAIVEPKRETALIGAIVMEVLDVVVDCTRLALVPRDPKNIISEVE